MAFLKSIKKIFHKDKHGYTLHEYEIAQMGVQCVVFPEKQELQEDIFFHKNTESEVLQLLIRAVREGSTPYCYLLTFNKKIRIRKIICSLLAKHLELAINRRSEELGVPGRPLFLETPVQAAMLLDYYPEFKEDCWASALDDLNRIVKIRQGEL